MRISKKRWNALEKRVTDLELQVQSQPRETSETIANHLKEILLKQTLQHSSDVPAKF